MIGPGAKELDVFIQDPTSPLFQYFVMNEQNVFPISSYLKQENQNSKNEKK